MSRGGQGIARALAEGINGYTRGMGIARQMDKEKRDEDYQDEVRSNARTDRARADSERTAVVDAMRPAQVDEGAGGMTKPATADNSDVGQPGEPGVDSGGLIPGALVNGKASANPTADAAAYNAPDAQNARLLTAMRTSGKPMEAAQLEASQTQAAAAKFKLSSDMEKHVNDKADQLAMTVTTPDQLKSFLSGSPMVGGKEVSIVTSGDGKKFQMMVPGADGNMVKFGQEIGSDPTAIQKAVAMQFTHMKPTEKVAVLQHAEQFAEQQRQFEETKTMQREQFAQNKQLQQQQIGISAAHLGIARDAQGLAREKFDADLKNDPTRNLPGAVKLSIGGMDKTLAGIEAAITKAQAEGQWDPKTPGSVELLARKAKLEGDRARLIKPYADGAGAGAATGPNYMEFGKTKPPAGAAPAAPAPGAAAAPVQGAAATSKVASPPDLPQGQQLDAARVNYDTAVVALRKWGLAQQAKDPQGYAIARQAVAQAKVARDAAEQEYATAVAPMAGAATGVAQRP